MRRVWGVVAGAVLVGGPAWGQAPEGTVQPDGPPAQAVEIAPAATETSAEALTVYGTSNPLPVFDYPGQVTVVTREEIELFAPSTMADMLRDVPGLEFSGGPRRTGETPSLRGFGRENVLILLDGARQSFISGHDGRFFIDPGLIQTAEVVRGPASALYGSGATGGVLAFETVSAADLLEDGQMWGARIRLGYAGVNDEDLAAITLFGRSEGLDLLGSFGIRQSGDIRLGSGFDLPSDDEIETALLKATLALGQGISLTGSYTRFANNAFEPNNGQGVALSTDPTLRANVDKEIRSETWNLTASLAPTGQDWLDADLTLYRSNNAVDELDASVPRTLLRDIETTGASLRNRSRFDVWDAKLTLTLGADWYEDKQVGRDSTAGSGLRAGVPNGSAEFTGLFAQIEADIDRPFGLPGDLLVIPGIRFDSFESQADGIAATNADDATSARVGVSYGPVEWMRVFGSFSQSFRAPSINELYLSGVHFPVLHPIRRPPAFPPLFVFNNFIPNPNLTPERGDTVELGFALDLRDTLAGGDRLQLKASAYESEVEDLIDLFVDFRFAPSCFAPPTFLPCNAGTTESRNVRDARLRGVELEAIYEWEALRARLAYGTIDGEDQLTGADLGTLTPDRLSLDLRWTLEAWDAAIGTRVQLADDFERVALAGGTLAVVERRGAYAVLDLYATWSPDLMPGLRLDAGIDNVFDTNYERVFEGVSEPGINGRVALTYSFGG